MESFNVYLTVDRSCTLGTLGSTDNRLRPPRILLPFSILIYDITNYSMELVRVVPMGSMAAPEREIGAEATALARRVVATIEGLNDCGNSASRDGFDRRLTSCTSRWQGRARAVLQLFD